jgi:pyruvate,water dikinase
MELAEARWSENAESFDALLRHAGRRTKGSSSDPCPTAVWEGIAEEARLATAQRTALHTELGRLHQYLGLRETAKHYLLKGYLHIRRVLLELDRRFELAGGIFYVLPDELPRLAAGEDLAPLIQQRKRRRSICLTLEVPPVLFSDNLNVIGQPAPIEGKQAWQGIPLSAGSAEGPALVLESPQAAEMPPDPYVLVCPSTDPAWVPLFVGACALVMETGGVLSHGAIVAREFGLPAVAGLPGIQRTLRTGQRLHVNGATGTVTLLDAEACLADGRPG